MRTSRPASAAAAIAAAAVVLVGCGSSDGEQHGTDDHTQIDPAAPQVLDADGTAETSMQVILSWQPTTDAGKTDALRRATPWLGGDLLEVVDRPAATGLRPDRDWEAWKSSGDVLTAACARADSTPAAPAGMRTLVIDVTCTQQVLYTTKTSTRLTPETWRTTVTRTDDGWRLTDYRYQRQG